MTKVLFQKGDIYSLTESLKRKVKDAFRTIPDAELDADAVAVAARLIEEFSLNVPVIDADKKYALTKQTQVDVSQDPMRNILDRSRPFYIRGTEVKVVIPFEGDAWMFDVRPTMFSMNPPIGGIKNNELHFVYKLADAGFDVSGDVNRQLGYIDQHLRSLRDSAEIFKNELQQLVSGLIQQRKRDRDTHSKIVANLKMPVKQQVQKTQAVPEQTTESKVAARPEDEWDVFISHASEDKEAIATPLAEALQESGLRVWYDDFSLRLGDSLRESIDRGLARSRFGVVILSGHFFSKHWPTQELNGLATREADGEKVILPVWHGVGFAEVRGYSVTLADRKAVRTKDGLAHVVEKIMEVVRPR
jgi:TIR domain.